MNQLSQIRFCVVCYTIRDVFCFFYLKLIKNIILKPVWLDSFISNIIANKAC